MRRSDVIPALLMLVLSVAIFIETFHLEYYGEVSPGPAFLPVWLALGGGVLVVLRLLEARRLAGSAAVEWPDRPGLRRIALIVVGLVAVPLLTSVIGMIPAILLFMAFLLLVVLQQSVVPSLLTIALTGGLVYGIFVRWLGVALPTGALGI
jgi:putative tricarboxylic transport membrane protein